MKDRLQEGALMLLLAILFVPFTVLMLVSDAASRVKTAAIMSGGTPAQKRRRLDLVEYRRRLLADPYEY